MGNVLNVSFYPSEIGKQLDLIYIRFKRGARRELTGCTRVSGLVHIARCARERLAEQNQARDLEYKRALRDRLHVNGSSVTREMRSEYEKRVTSIQRHGLCVRLLN